MKIKTRLQITSLLTAGIVLIMGLIFVLTVIMRQDARERSLVANDLMRGAFDLTILTDNYLRQPEERPKEQWIINHDTLIKELRQVPAGDSRQQVLINRMSQNLNDMKSLFDKLVETYGEDRTGRQTRDWQLSNDVRRSLLQLSDLIVHRSRELSLDASRLAAASEQERTTINRNVEFLFAAVIFFLLGTVVWSSTHILRSVAGPITDLRAGTEMIGSGNLDYRIGITTQDEIGELSNAFDKMAENLRTTTVSRDALAQEIAERIRLEKEFRDLSKKYELILQSAGDGIFGVDTDGKHTFVNNAAASMLGYNIHDLIGKQSHPIYHYARPDGSPYPSEECPIYAAYRDGALHSGEEVFWKKDGTGFPVEFTSRPLRREQKIIGAVVTFRDISERKRAEQELRRSEAQLRTIFENITEGLVVADLEGNLFHWNPAAVAIHGFATLEEAHRKLDEFPEIFELSGIDGLVWPLDEWPLARILRGEQIQDLEVRIRRINSDWQRVFSYGGTLVRDINGDPLLAVVTVSDITGRKKAEAERERLISDLERSNRELEQFAYVASHDLQEPLRMVASYVQLLERKYRGRLDAQADKYIYYAVDGAERMQKLIEGLLAYSRIARRGAEFRTIDMNTVFSGIVSNLAVAIRESHASITKGDLPTVSGDEIQLIQLLQNLISNGIKFRKPDAPPRISVSAQKEGSEWVFSVQDNGIGIEPKYFERIFLIFQRLHSRQEYPGTGIGLALCKRIVERHHGRIWVESSPGKGSTFYFTIPIGGK